MSEIQVVILAAGLGTRLNLPLPKPLAPLADGRSILGHQLDNLRQAFADTARIAVVVGFRYDLIMRAAPEVRFVYNERYDETKSLFTNPCDCSDR
jgi:choline kinase